MLLTQVANLYRPPNKPLSHQKQFIPNIRVLLMVRVEHLSALEMESNHPNNMKLPSEPKEAAALKSLSVSIRVHPWPKNPSFPPATNKSQPTLAPPGHKKKQAGRS